MLAPVFGETYRRAKYSQSSEEFLKSRAATNAGVVRSPLFPMAESFSLSPSDTLQLTSIRRGAPRSSAAWPRATP